MLNKRNAVLQAFRIDLSLPSICITFLFFRSVFVSLCTPATFNSHLKIYFAYYLFTVHTLPVCFTLGITVFIFGISRHFKQISVFVCEYSPYSLLYTSWHKLFNCLFGIFRFFFVGLVTEHWHIDLIQYERSKSIRFFSLFICHPFIQTQTNIVCIRTHFTKSCSFCLFDYII